MDRPPLPDPYPVPSDVTVWGRAELPSSKSLTHRALILSALAEGESLISRVLDAEDTRATLECLSRCGISFRMTSGGVGVAGSAGRLLAPMKPLSCRASGTTLRLLMAICGGQEGVFTLDGDAQLRLRPVADMEAPLRALGAGVGYAQREGYPPVVMRGSTWTGGSVLVSGRTSSQFLSGLLIASPLASSTVSLQVEELVSRPYVEMTTALMERFGVHVGHPGPNLWTVEPSRYRGAAYTVEPDASAAAFLWAAGAVTGGRVRIAGLSDHSLQGDACFPEWMAAMGCEVVRDADGTEVGGRPLRGLEADVAATPDLVPALIAVALFAPSQTVLTGVRHLRYKESDRLAVLAEGVTAMGGCMLVEDDRLTVVPADSYIGAVLDPHQDHRMAMAFAVMGLRISGVRIKEPDCVAKSFPEFFETLRGLIHTVR
jgi:3-phosphoshikimate 1-carboxyvinyltransferase